jgi:hypothetical protein
MHTFRRTGIRSSNTAEPSCLYRHPWVRCSPRAAPTFQAGVRRGSAGRDRVEALGRTLAQWVRGARDARCAAARERIVGENPATVRCFTRLQLSAQPSEVDADRNTFAPASRSGTRSAWASRESAGSRMRGRLGSSRIMRHGVGPSILGSIVAMGGRASTACSRRRRRRQRREARAAVEPGAPTEFRRSPRSSPRNQRTQIRSLIHRHRRSLGRLQREAL